jgi:TP901 family phage tail tape measure protein
MRAAEQAGMYVDAQGRLREANGRFASSARQAEVSANAEAAGYDRAAAAAGRAGESAVVAGRKTKAAGAEAAGFGSAMKTAFLGVAVAGGYGIEQAAKFQASMAQLHTQAGVSQAAVKGLSTQVLQLAAQVGEGPTSLSEALYHVASNMASTGATGTQMMDALRVAAQGAQVGNANLEDVTNALGAAIASGIPGVENYTSAMGMMNATVGAGDMRMQDLADAFGTGLLANIKLYGVTLRDVSAALATFGDNNIRGAKAGTDLKMAVQALAVQGPAAKAALHQLGLGTKSLSDAMKKGGLNEALQLLVTRMHAAGVSAKDQGQLITDLFGKKAGAGIGVLIGEFDRFQGKFKDIQKGANAFAGDWAARSQTMQQQWHNLVAGAQALAISFGTLLLPAATKIVGVIGRFANFLEKHQAIAAFAGGILALVAAFGLLASAASVVGDGIAVLTNPVFLVIAAIAALSIGFYELYKHSKTFRDIVADVGRFFAATWRNTVQMAGMAIKWFENGPLKDIEKAIAYFKSWWAANGAEVRQVWAELWAVIKVIAVTYWRIVSTEIRLGLTVLMAVWRVAWGAIKDAALWAWNVIKAEVTMAVHIVMDVIAVFLDIVTGHWSKAWRDVQKLFRDAVNGITGIAKAWASGFVRFFEDLGRNIVQGLISGIKSMFGAVGSVVSSLGSGIVGGFKSILGIASPSRKTYAIGVQLAQGLADGLASSAAPASAAGKVASDLLSSIKEATAARVIGLSEGSSLSAWVQADNARLQALGAQRATIAKTIAAAQKYAATTTSNTEQAFGLMSVAGSQPFTAGDIAAGLRQDVSQITAFKSNIQKLARMGLNKAYIDQLIQAGPVQGGMVAAELASGSWADIKSINVAESQIASASTSLGRTAAEAMYDSGSQAGKGFLSGLMAQEQAITAMMSRIAKSMVDTIKHDLGIHSPSAVFAGHGRAVIDGFLMGLEDGPSRVGGAMKALAGATTMPYGGIGAGLGGGGTTSVTINVHVDGFIGSNQQLAGEIYRAFQSEALRSNHRNPTNGLALAFGRG